MSRGTGAARAAVQRRAPRSGALPGAAARPRSADGSGRPQLASRRRRSCSRCGGIVWPQRSGSRRPRCSPRGASGRRRCGGMSTSSTTCRCCPRDCCRRVVGYPRRDAYDDGRLASCRSGGRCRVRSRRAAGCGSPVSRRSTSGTARAVDVRARAGVLRGRRVGARCRSTGSHAHVRELEEEPASVEAVNPGPRHDASRGVGSRSAVLACEAVEIRVGGRPRGDPRRCGLSPGDNTILVPEGEHRDRRCARCRATSTATATGARRTSGPTAAALAEAIALLRSTNPAGALLRLIAEARPERYPSLRGKRFTVEVGDDPA